MTRRDFVPILLIPVLGVIAILQSVLGPRLTLFTVKPDLTLLFVVAWTLVYGRREGIVLGFVGGIWLDLFGGGWMGTSSLALMTASLVAGIGYNTVYRTHLLVPLGLAFHTHSLPPGQLATSGQNLEAAARTARYAFLAQVARNVTPADQTPTVAVAHHADDQLETVLLHLIRGSGLDGLSGMRWVTEMIVNSDDHPHHPHEDGLQETATSHGLRVVRPLLLIERAQIHAYLKATNLPWREDTTNQDTTLIRNRIRHKILPSLKTINPNVTATISRMTQVIAGDTERLHSLDQNVLNSILFQSQMSASSRLLVNWDAFSNLSRPEQRGVLRAALQQLMPVAEWGFETVERLIDAWATQTQPTHSHPVANGLAWTYIAPSTWPDAGEHPALFSLHQQASLPLASLTPYLQPGTRSTLSCNFHHGALIITPAWTLTGQLCSPAQVPPDWQDNADPWRAFLDWDICQGLALRTPKEGDRFAPLGLKGRNKSVGDYFTDSKIPAYLRDGWPLLVCNATDEILWVCGQRLAHAARITEKTKQICWLQWVPTIKSSSGRKP